MQAAPSRRPTLILRAVGSLWFAAVLLVLLLVAMACATVYESTRGAEHALRIFYTSGWFTLLLALVGVNALAALLLRYPFSRKRIGFVITHVSILLVLAGALVTKQFGVNGRIAIVEGQTVADFRAKGEELAILNLASRTSTVVDLDADIFGLAEALDPKAGAARLGDLSVAVERYLPDSRVGERVVDDNRYPQPAVEVSLSSQERGRPTWVFAGQDGKVGLIPVGFHIVTDEEELDHLLHGLPAPPPTSLGTVRIQIEGSTFEVPAEACMDQPAPLDDVGRTVRILRYLPHASVGADNQVTSISDRPVNPAIEVELTGPDGSEKRLAFAKFPDFSSMHGSPRDDEVKVAFVTSVDSVPDLPIQVLGGPDGKLYVRLSGTGAEVVAQELDIGEPVATPWHGRTFTVLRRFERARVERVAEPVVPVRETRIPAVLLRLSTADETDGVWVQKYRSRRVPIGGIPFELAYGDKSLPLGFKLTLDGFRIGHYPGTSRPRSFESHITITSQVTGRTLSRVISMNSPVKYGRYSLFQSSYQPGRQKAMSILSVSRDPGLPIVFTGYIAMMAGMLVILGTRIGERRRSGRRLESSGRDFAARSIDSGPSTTAAPSVHGAPYAREAFEDQNSPPAATPEV